MFGGNRMLFFGISKAAELLILVGRLEFDAARVSERVFRQDKDLA
jgi:hypothetical protein